MMHGPANISWIDGGPNPSYVDACKRCFLNGAALGRKLKGPFFKPLATNPTTNSPGQLLIGYLISLVEDRPLQVRPLILMT